MHAFIRQHREDDLNTLALTLANRKIPEAPYLLQQIEGWQRLRAKVPSWTETDGLEYPPRLSLEQCSGETAARYKAETVTRLLPEGGTMADLTGGLGVDFSFMARHFSRAVYVERQEELCRLARHNFPLLGLETAEVVCADGEDYLRQMPPADLIFIDPARRDAAGRKTVLIENCTPDVVSLLPLIMAKCRIAVVKLSPMLDIHRAIAAIGHSVAEVHIVAAGGECKELLLVLRNDNGGKQVCVADGSCRFNYAPEDEQTALVTWAGEVETYLFEPGAALMKAGAFRLISERFGLKKLHPNSHLYTAATPVKDFPGRTFAVEGVYGFSKKELRALCATGERANIAVRNFPSTVAELRRRLKVKEGGTAHWFATTLADGRRVVITAKRES